LSDISKVLSLADIFRVLKDMAEKDSPGKPFQKINILWFQLLYDIEDFNFQSALKSNLA